MAASASKLTDEACLPLSGKVPSATRRMRLFLSYYFVLCFKKGFDFISAHWLLRDVLVCGSSLIHHFVVPLLPEEKARGGWEKAGETTGKAKGARGRLERAKGA